MVNSPLIRPAISWGGSFRGGTLDYHENNQNHESRWWIQIFLDFFHPNQGEMIQFDGCIFFEAMGFFQPPPRFIFSSHQTFQVPKMEILTYISSM